MTLELSDRNDPPHVISGIILGPGNSKHRGPGRETGRVDSAAGSRQRKVHLLSYPKGVWGWFLRKLITGNKMIRVAFRQINLKLESLESKKSTVNVKVKPNESLNLVSESKVGKEIIPLHDRKHNY